MLGPGSDTEVDTISSACAMQMSRLITLHTWGVDTVLRVRQASAAFLARGRRSLAAIRLPSCQVLMQEALRPLQADRSRRTTA